MTPSGWGDDTRGRDAGHDALQQSVYRWFKTRKINSMRIPKGVEVSGFIDGSGMLKSRSVVYEYAVTKWDKSDNLTIMAFADVAELWRPADNTQIALAALMEIKPKIDGVGAVVRQCRAVALAFRNSNPKAVCHTIPVVPWNDPKLSMLQDILRCIPWKDDAPYDLSAYPFRDE